MVKTHQQLRPKFTTHADGSDARAVHPRAGRREDGPTVGISRVDPRQREHRLAGHPRSVPPAQGHAAQGPHPAAAGRQSARLRRQPPLHPARRAEPQPRVSRRRPRQLHPAARRRARPANTSTRSTPTSTSIRAPTGRPSTTSTSGTTRGCRAPSARRCCTARPQGKTARVYTGTTKIGDHRQAPKSRSWSIELGGGIVDQTPYVKRTVDGMLNQLRQLGGIAGDVTPPPKQVVVHELAGIRPKQAAGSRPLAPANGEIIKGGAAARPRRQPLQFRDLEEIPTPVRERHHDHAAPDAATSSRPATTASWSATSTARDE